MGIYWMVPNGVADEMISPVCPGMGCIHLVCMWSTSTIHTLSGAGTGPFNFCQTFYKLLTVVNSCLLSLSLFSCLFYLCHNCLLFSSISTTLSSISSLPLHSLSVHYWFTSTALDRTSVCQAILVPYWSGHQPYWHQTKILIYAAMVLPSTNQKTLLWTKWSAVRNFCSHM